MLKNELEELLNKVEKIAYLAGDAVMSIYESDDFDIELKADNSPLTKADNASNKFIVDELSKVSEFPIISEENTTRSAEGPFWLVDPLDGTKEFIKKNGEFTVNIALIENGSPVLGVVYAPAKKVLYSGAKEIGAFKEDGHGRIAIEAKFEGSKPVVITSRSHRDNNIDTFLTKLGEYDEVHSGSSLKLCLVADGTASIHPRLAPTYVWDTAAADAVVAAAGGSVVDAKSGKNLNYSLRENLLNPYFVVLDKGKNLVDYL